MFSFPLTDLGSLLMRPKRRDLIAVKEDTTSYIDWRP